jgi:MoaA/NifB/PqqE/SkfB family radical SAM enzyme
MNTKPRAVKRITVLEYEIVRILMVLNIWWIGVKLYHNPIEATKVVSKLLQNFKRMLGKNKLVRAFKVDSKYSWDMFNPAWPSQGFNTFFRSHLIEIQPTATQTKSLRRLLIAITKRCPLQCEHCSEAATLYNSDVLSYDEFASKIETFVNDGVGQLVYSGGEPLARFEDLIKLLENFKVRCDQWIYTSAYGLTREKAFLLKAAGLNGAAISLDNHVEAEHNTFRGNKRSYEWVLEGVKHLQEAGVLVALNVCPTKDYIEAGGVEKLVDLAKSLNVPMVNLLEPRAVGNYQDKNVELEEIHKQHLERISIKFNFNKSYLNSPTVLYPAMYRKAMPCGGGRSYLLLDYDGTLYPCPFCKTKMPTPKSKVALCEAV